MIKSVSYLFDDGDSRYQVALLDKEYLVFLASESCMAASCHFTDGLARVRISWTA